MATATKTKTALDTLERLTKAREAAHAEARAARDRVSAHEAQYPGMVRVPPAPELEAKRDKTVVAFHRAEAEEAKFRVANAAVLFAELTPRRDQAGDDLAADFERLRATLARYHAYEHQALEALRRLGIPGRDLRTDPRVTALAGALDSIELDNVQPPYSQTLETPEDGRPFYQESDDGTGWVAR